jgi:hypothetical protein
MHGWKGKEAGCQGFTRGKGHGTKPVFDLWHMHCWCMIQCHFTPDPLLNHTRCLNTHAVWWGTHTKA